ncbi:MAG: hypothetical protein C0507_12325 [Cyanobacteria bacterium PR.3.49]|nr:hypothetical protein [Cyanobacteria bacterium PR.3.49]
MSRYFTESEVASMLDELTETLPKSIALHLAECGAQLGAVDQKPTLEDEFTELRRAFTGTKERLGLFQVLPIIQRECHHVLIPRTELRDSSQLRRPDISKLPVIMSMPGNVLSPDLVFRMFDTTVERSFDTYENRLVKAYVQALRGRLSRMQGKMEKAQSALLTDIETLISEFNLACARATFLREVKLPTVFAGRVTMVLLKKPAYRIVFEDYLALKQESSVTLEETALNDPKKHIPYLYELWTNLRVLNSMLQVCVESGFRCVSHNWIKRFNKGIFIQLINDEKAAIELTHPSTGRRVTLVSWKPDGGNEILEDTPEHERLIALAVIIDAPGEQSQLLVFDPEYRVNAKDADFALEKILEARSKIEPMKEDIDDLIRWVKLAGASDSARTIPYAAILYPGPGMKFTSEVEALTAVPSDGDGLEKAVCDVLRRYLA